MPDVSHIGLEVDSVRFPVERGKVREFVRSLRETDPVYLDEDAARAAGFRQIPVPLTFPMVAMQWRDRDAMIEDLGFDLARLLHGGVSWEYLLPVAVGDELTASRRVTAVTQRPGKRGGQMTFVTVETELVNQDGELAIRQEDTLIETGS